MIDNYASYNKRFFFETSSSAYEARKSRKALCSATFSPPPINTFSTILVLLLVCIQILYGCEISINSSINIAITWHILDLRDKFYQAHLN